MLRLIAIAVLPLLAVCVDASQWDPRYAKLFGIGPDGRRDLMNGGNQNDGRWDCPWELSGTNCRDGNFFCKCPGNSAQISFTIGCCYHFPNCGNICNKGWGCSRYVRCATCKSHVSEWDMKACASCVKGFVYESGLCNKDLNECARANGGCEQLCYNTYGSYYCKCRPGFSLKSDKHSCLRLSCNGLSPNTGVTVKPTESWLFASFAKYATVAISNTLDGPYVRECVAASSSPPAWENIDPRAVATCNQVTSRVQCSTADTTRDKCLQLGCCYNDNPTYAPSCYLNPVKNYVRYGGVSPKAGLDNGIKTYKNYGVETCSHKCLSHPGGTCKSFGIRSKGGNATHDVTFQDCHLLPKTKPDYAKAGEETTNRAYDMYDFFPPPGYIAPLSTNANPLDKQYVGCFKESAADLDLTRHIGSSSSHMDAPLCINMCRLQGYAFAGLQKGTECYCGYALHRKHGPSTACTATCPGDASRKCGGVNANSVYRVSWSEAYQGCYKDKESARDLPFFVWGWEASRSANECINECSVRNYAYAGVQDGGDCYCGNAYGSQGPTDETACFDKCYGYARQNCGGVSVNAIYKTKMAVKFGSSVIDSRVTRLYDTTGQMNGITTSIFTLYPGLRTILSKRLIIHADQEVVVPAEATCTSDCYKPCGEIYHDERISNKGSDVTLRFFYVKLSDITKYIGSAAQRVSVYAQTVLIDSDLKFDFALSVRTKDLIVDRSRAYFIDIASTAKAFDIDTEAEKFSDPEPNLLQQKQSIMCARMLLETRQMTHIDTAFSVLTHIAWTSSKNREARALATTARNLVVEVAGVGRDDIHYVPFYKKSHLADILDTYYEQISIYQRELTNLVEKAEGKDQVLDFVEGLHKIYSETDILEAETAHEAAVDAVARSNATYARFKSEYELSRQGVEDARGGFEAGLEEKKGWEITKLLIKFLSKTSKAIAGAVGSDDKDGDKKKFIEDETFDEVFQLLEEVTALVRQINDLAAIADQVIKAIEDLEDEYNAMRYYDEIEMTVQLQSNIVKWQNLKNYAETILGDDDVASVRGCTDYHRALLDLCNWGEALTRSMVERAELMREASEKRTVFDLKKEQKSRIDDHIQDYRDDLFSEELLITAMIEQSYDVRVDLNDALLTFCQAYFYENMFECKESYRPSFGGSMDQLLLRVNAARRDDLFVGAVPSTLKRYITITDTDKDPLCSDATVCPINYLRKFSLLYFPVPINHKDLSDIDAYKVTELILKFNGVASTTDNKHLKVLIESSGRFEGRADSKVYSFMTRALSLAFEYNIDTAQITVHADVYQPFRNIIQHITPFTTWVMRISDARSSDIDLSDVTSVRIQYNGSGVDNETWKRKHRAALSS